MRSLRRAARRRGREAEELFWSRVSDSGTPLIEPIPRDYSHSWVTYVWRGSRNVQSVGLSCPQAGFGVFDKLERIPNCQTWFRTFRTRNDCFGHYKFLPNPPDDSPSDVAEYFKLLRTARLDPLNPTSFTPSRDPDDPQNLLFERSVSILELPRAPHHSEVEEHAGVPQGTLALHRVRSRILRNTRRVWAYIPAGYQRIPSHAPLVIFFDGQVYGATRTIPTPTILDNLIHTNHIPPTGALFVDSIDPQTRNVELPGYEPFGGFLVQELLPWTQRTLNFSPTPEKTVLAGVSYGGLAAIYQALQHPALFQRVLSQTGSVGWSPKGVDEPVWLAREFMRQPRLPLAIYMDVGRYEARSEPENDVGHLAANRHLRDVLQLKGYPLLYHEFCGAHHLYCCRQTLVEGLRWVLSDAWSAR